MTNATALHVVRPIGDDWRLVTPGGFDGVMPAGRHTFEIDAWEHAAMLVRDAPGVAIVYDRHGAVEWTLRQ